MFKVYLYFQQLEGVQGQKLLGNFNHYQVYNLVNNAERGNDPLLKPTNAKITKTVSVVSACPAGPAGQHLTCTCTSTK